MTQEKSLYQLIGASFAFYAVAVLCAAAGFRSEGTLQIPDMNIIAAIAIIALPLLPYFYLREVVLEQPIDIGASIMQKDRVQISVIIFGLLLIISILLLFNSFQFSLEKVILMECFGYSPFIYLSARMLSTTRSEEMLKREYRFTSRVLFPGLATCIVPFALGWTIRENDYYALIISALVVIIGDVACRRDRFSLLNFLCLLFCSIFISSFFINKFKPLNIIVFGSVLSFAMGTAEACKRVNLVKNGRIPRAEGEDTNFYLAGANWASSAFPVFLYLLPLLVPKFPTLWALGYNILYILVWQIMITNKESRTAFWASLGLGYLLPFGIAFFPDSWNIPLLDSDNLILIIGMFSASMAAVFFTINYLRNKTKDNLLYKLIQNESYIDHKSSLGLLFFIIVVMIFYIALLATLLSLFDEKMAPMYKLKATQIVFGLIILALLRLMIAGIQGDFGSKGRDSDENTDALTVEESSEKKTKQQERSSKFIAIYQIMRPDVSLIAGIFVTSALLVSTNIGITLAFIFGFPITLVTMLGFVINDIMDYEKDCLAGTQKPIATGSISIKEATTVGIIILFLLSSTELLIGNYYSHIVLSITFAGVVAYSLIAKWLPWAKGIVTALLCMSPFFYYSAISGHNVSVTILGCLFVFIAGRELLMDSIELLGDLKASVRTLPYYLGKRKSRTLSWLAMFIASICLCILMTGISFTLSAVAIAVLALSLYISLNNENHAVLFTRVSMLLGVVAVALSL